MGKTDIAIYPIFIPFVGCPNKCIYCDQLKTSEPFSPKSIDLKKIFSFINFNKKKRKEIAFFGGTFTNQKKLDMDRLFNLFCKVSSKIDGFRISTRPDFINEDILKYLKSKKVINIELGVQSFSDKVLKNSLRGYNKKRVITSCYLVKKYGFNLTIQLMPFLQSEDKISLKETVNETVKISPEYVRIYPTIVIKGTYLEELYKKGYYTPPTLKQGIKVVAKMKTIFEKAKIKVIKVGVHSDIPKESIIAGVFHPAFGQMVECEILKRKILLAPNKNNCLVVSRRNYNLIRARGVTLQKELEQKIKNLVIKKSSKLKKGEFYFEKMVGDTGFEPVTSTMST